MEHKEAEGGGMGETQLHLGFALDYRMHGLTDKTFRGHFICSREYLRILN